MPLVERKRWTPDEEDAALTLLDPLLFLLCFWKDDLTIPPDRVDLPESWRGRQVISREQRMMFLDGADYMLLRDAHPQLAQKSSQQVLARTSRKVAKTVNFESKIIQIPLTKTMPGIQEGMVHAPGDPHLTPVINRVIQRVDSTPLFRLMHSKFDQGEGIQNWRNNFVWHFRIEGMATRQEFVGRSQVGIRARFMLGDEGDFSREDVFNQREQCALPGCFQFWGGVPRGVRGIHYRKALQGSGWHVHRMDMRANPLYHSQKAWEAQIAGDSYLSQRVQTQVLGRDGDEAVTSFPVIPVDHSLPFVHKKFSVSEYAAHEADLASFLEVPVNELTVEPEAWMIHGDYGYSPSPMELGVSYLYNGVWHQLARYEILQLDPTRTANLIVVIDNDILPSRAVLIVIDAHGQGRGVLSALRYDPRWEGYGYEERALDVGFAGNTQLPDVLIHKRCRQRVRVSEDGVWVCDSCHIEIYERNELSEAFLNTKGYLTDEMKNAFVRGNDWLVAGRGAAPDGAALVLGRDPEAINELKGMTEVARQGGTRYVPLQDGMEHITDMLRCLTSGAIRYIQMHMNGDSSAEADEFGWMRVAPGPSGWKAPWGL